jgi:hypothetical protein
MSCRRFLFRLLTGILVVLPAALWAGSIERILVTDIDGAEHVLPDPQRKATVLFFVTHDCPVSNSYAPEIDRIYASYARRNIAFYIVYVDPSAPLTVVKKHAKEFGFGAPVVADTTHSLVHLVGATMTPEVGVLQPDGSLFYRGRIDDLYFDLGKRRNEPTEHDLREALDAVLNGKPMSNPITKAVGCFIPSIR